MPLTGSHGLLLTRATASPGILVPGRTLATTAAAARGAGRDGCARPEESARRCRRHCARRLLFEKYQGRYSGDLSRWRTTALPVAVDLDSRPT
jgi:hypothetical protein